MEISPDLSLLKISSEHFLVPSSLIAISLDSDDMNWPDSRGLRHISVTLKEFRLSANIWSWYKEALTMYGLSTSTKKQMQQNKV
jgi:hypothetical protein